MTDLLEALEEALLYAVDVNKAIVKGEAVPQMFGPSQWGDGYELGRWETAIARARGIGQNIDVEA